ncbi:hypothetical protein D3C72_2191840 [compost metagenome]
MTREHAQSMNGHLAWLPFKFDAIARVFVQWFAVDLERGIHGRYLGNFTHKLRQHALNVSLRYLTITLAHHIPFFIASGGGDTKLNCRDIGFIFVG